MLWYLYLALQLDSIRQLAAWLCVLSFFTGCISTFISFCYKFDAVDGDTRPLEYARMLRPFRTVGLGGFFITSLLLGFLPTSKNMAIIVAGGAVVEASQNPTVQSIAGNSARLIDDWIKKQVADIDYKEKKE